MKILDILFGWLFRRDNCQHISEKTNILYVDDAETLEDIIESNPPVIERKNVHNPKPLEDRIQYLYEFFDLLSDYPKNRAELIKIARNANNFSGVPAPTTAENRAIVVVIGVFPDLSDTDTKVVTEGVRFLTAIRRDYGDAVFERVVAAFLRLDYI